MKSRKSAIKTDLFAADLHHQKLDQLGDPLLRIGACIDFTALAHACFRVTSWAWRLLTKSKIAEAGKFSGFTGRQCSADSAKQGFDQHLAVSPGKSARRSVSFCLVTIIELFFQLFQPMAWFCGESKRTS
jgi:hypothetical protein